MSKKFKIDDKVYFINNGHIDTGIITDINVIIDHDENINISVENIFPTKDALISALDSQDV